MTHGNTELRSLMEADLEMVRKWRNDLNVNRHLLHRGHILPEMQVKWFNELDCRDSLYLVASENGIPFGLIYATDIDWEGRSFWGNIIVGHTDYRDGHLPVKCIVMLMWYFFKELDFKVCYSKVSTENRAAVELNRRLGFEFMSSLDGIRTEICGRLRFFSQGETLLRVMLLGVNPMVSSGCHC